MDERLYNAEHRRIGTVTKDAIGNDVIRDENGRVVARFDYDAIGNRVLKDPTGKTIGIFSKDGFGEDAILDGNGRVIARLDKDFLGGDALLDASGGTLGYSERAETAYDDDDDDRPAYTLVNGVKIYPRSPLEKKFDAAKAPFAAPAYIAFLLPAVYAAAAIFFGKLPAWPELLIGLLTAGIFFSSVFGRAAGMPRSTQVGTFFISILLFFVWFVIWTSFRTSWNVTEKKELTVLLGAPALFLAAELIGGAIGHAKYNSMKKKIFGYK